MTSKNNLHNLELNSKNKTKKRSTAATYKNAYIRVILPKRILEMRISV